MNNSHVRMAVARVFGDTMSSYTQKRDSARLFRFETRTSEETLALLEAIEAHKNAYPGQLSFFQIYGIDGAYENTGAIIILGTRYIPTPSPLFTSALNTSVVEM